MNVAERLDEICNKLSSNQYVEPLTVRQFISWFNAERRGYMVAWHIRKALQLAKLVTVPDFDGVHIDAKIRFVMLEHPDVSAASGQPIQEDAQSVQVEIQQENIPPFIMGASADPAFRVGRLESANIKPLSVSPDCLLGEAVTLMLRHDYSQLPVMTNDRDVKGIISWESIGSRLALKKESVSTARECMKPHYEVQSTDSLFRVIAHIIEHSYVLVRGEDRTITGIITTSDLSLQFQQLSEPFLLLSEIENHVRLVIDGKFTAEELASAKDYADPERTIESVADLTLGEYIRLLENPVNWEKAGLTVDRKVFVRELDNVRRIRNDVMHFDPDGITNDDHKLLRYFLQFMHELREIAG
ncbi:MAG: CBS domain-containing protein [Gallionella sp.]|nr:CBS domain-containing protein [Gallionella sp.]